MIHDSGDSPPTFYGTSCGRKSAGTAGGQRARDEINEDVSAEFDGWRVTATKRRSDVDDEKQRRAFSGFDECTGISWNR
jgi:hypothetical protein